MIQANAKCIVNGDKVNETIMAVNSLMNVDIVVGNVDVPQIKHFPTGFLIVLPRGSSYANEELYYVDTNNDVASRWFVTSTSQASTTPVSTSGTPTGKQSSAPASKDRNSLGNTPKDKNRDKLDKGAAPIGNGAGGVMPAGMVKPGSQAAKDGFDDTPRLGNFMVKPGSQAANEGFNDVPLPGAPPLGGDTTPKTKTKLSSDPSLLRQIVAAKTKRDNELANQRIYEKAAAIRKKKEDAAAKARAYKAKIAAGNLARKAAGDKLAAKAAKRAQLNIKEASSPVRTSKIVMLKEQLTSKVRQLAMVDAQIAKDRANHKIHSSSSPLMKRREQLEADRKRIASEMTSL